MTDAICLAPLRTITIDPILNGSNSRSGPQKRIPSRDAVVFTDTTSDEEVAAIVEYKLSRGEFDRIRVYGEDSIDPRWKLLVQKAEEFGVQFINKTVSPSTAYEYLMWDAKIPDFVVDED